MLTEIDKETRAAMAQRYRLHGSVVSSGVSLPRAFRPDRTAIAFVRKGAYCEVYFDTTIQYSGGRKEWQEAFAQPPPSPGGFRLIASVKGDFTTALSTLEAALDEEPNNERQTATDNPQLHLRELVSEQRGMPERLTGRDALVRSIKTSLLRETKPGILLLGKPGVGKTALVTMVAWELANGRNVPAALTNTAIYDLPLGAMLEGSQAVGDLERQVRGLLEAPGNPVLFVDEVHQLARPELAPSRDLLKPALAAGTIRMVAATTNKEWRRIEDDAFKRRFTELDVPEPKLKEVAIMLASRVPGLVKHHSMAIEPALVNEAIVLVDRYVPQRQFPDKAVDVLDLAAALQSTVGSSDNQPHKSLQKRYLLEAVSGQSGLALDFVDSAGHGALLNTTRELLTSRLMGQDQALSSLLKTLRTRMALRQLGWQTAVSELHPAEDRRPLATILACGPTGVGKTETAKLVANAFFNGNLIVLNGSDVGPEAPHGAAMWTGSPPGYVGSQNGGILSDGLRATPAAVILVDEIEKASPEAVQNILLPLLGEGVVTDRNTGDALCATQCLIFCTSNIPVHPFTSDESPLKLQAPVSEADLRASLRGYLRPEIIGRFNALLHYQALSLDVSWQLFEKLLRQFELKLGANKEFVLTSKASLWLEQRLAENTSGARGIQDLFHAEVLPLLVGWEHGAAHHIHLHGNCLVLRERGPRNQVESPNCHNGALHSVQ